MSSSVLSEYKNTIEGVAECFYSDKTRAARFLNGFKNTGIGSPNKGSNCEWKILAYKKNKLCLISILYIKNTNEECFIGYKAHARDVLSVF